jgi:hypothetical protein
MDRIEQYRAIIQQVLTETYNFVSGSSDGDLEDVQYRLLFDREHDSYALLMIGFGRARRIHTCLVHLEIINGKIWLQADNTDFEIAKDLERAGIRKDEIVLGFHEPNVRPYTDYAAA